MNTEVASHSPLVVQVFALLILSYSLRRVLKPLGFPSVVAELLTGLILGPSFFGVIFPTHQEWLFPKNDVTGLSGIAQIGSLLLLILAGLEIDRRRIKGTKVGLLSLGGIAVPFTLGFAISPFLIQPEGGNQLIFSLFIATAMSISALSVMAKTFIDLGIIQSKAAQLALPAAMIDDTIGWILLSFITSVTVSKEFHVSSLFNSAYTIGGFTLTILLLGPYIISKIHHLSAQAFTACLGTCMAMAAASTSIKVEPILGAFITALVQPQEVKDEIKPTLEKIISALFAPIFFASAGLKINLTEMISPSGLQATVMIVAIACLGKVIGVYLGARLIKLGRNESLAIAWAMNARGSQEIIVASLGLRLGIIPQPIYGSLIIMSILTSLIAAPMLSKYQSKSIVDLQENRDALATVD